MDASAWDERYSSSDELVWKAEPNRFLEAQVTGLAPERALDLACGEGRNAVWLATQGWRVTGVDFSAAGLAKAERLAAERGVEVEWVHADVLAWLPEPGAYDLVVLLYLQLPEAERRTATATAVRALAPGGTLLVIGHDRRNLDEGVGGPQDPAVLFGPDDVVADLAALADATDLAVVAAESVERPVGDAAAIDCLVRARRAVSAADG